MCSLLLLLRMHWLTHACIPFFLAGRPRVWACAPFLIPLHLSFAAVVCRPERQVTARNGSPNSTINSAVTSTCALTAAPPETNSRAGPRVRASSCMNSSWHERLTASPRHHELLAISINSVLTLQADEWLTPQRAPGGVTRTLGDVAPGVARPLFWPSPPRKHHIATRISSFSTSQTTSHLNIHTRALNALCR